MRCFFTQYDADFFSGAGSVVVVRGGAAYELYHWAHKKSPDYTNNVDR